MGESTSAEGISAFATSSRARMGGVVDAGEMLKIEVGVNLRRGKVGMSQQLLDGAQVAARFEQVAGRAVPQQVRVNPLPDAALAGPALQSLLHGAGADRAAATTRKHAAELLGK